MARIAGVDLPREKRIEIGLTYVYGIGRTTSNKILKEAGVNPDTRVRNVTDDEVKRISEAIEKLGVTVEGDLRREIALNIKRLQEIGCYRGIRHRKSEHQEQRQDPQGAQEDRCEQKEIKKRNCRMMRK